MGQAGAACLPAPAAVLARAARRQPPGDAEHAATAAVLPPSPTPACPLPPCSSLLDYVRERKRLPEEEAQQIFQQLLHALQFCHRKDVSALRFL